MVNVSEEYATINTAIDRALIKKTLSSDTLNYIGVPYVWGGTTPAGFDCSGFVYYMFNKHGIKMDRYTLAGLFAKGTMIVKSHIEPGDLVFFNIDTSETITHVGVYIGDNQFVSVTKEKGVTIFSMDNREWADNYVGAKRIY